MLPDDSPQQPAAARRWALHIPGGPAIILHQRKGPVLAPKDEDLGGQESYDRCEILLDILLITKLKHNEIE